MAIRCQVREAQPELASSVVRAELAKRKGKPNLVAACEVWSRAPCIRRLGCGMDLLRVASPVRLNQNIRSVRGELLQGRGARLCRPEWSSSPCAPSCWRYAAIGLVTCSAAVLIGLPDRCVVDEAAKC